MHHLPLAGQAEEKLSEAEAKVRREAEEAALRKQMETKIRQELAEEERLKKGCSQQSCDFECRRDPKPSA